MPNYSLTQSATQVAIGAHGGQPGDNDFVWTSVHDKSPIIYLNQSNPSRWFLAGGCTYLIDYQVLSISAGADSPQQVYTLFVDDVSQGSTSLLIGQSTVWYQGSGRLIVVYTTGESIAQLRLRRTTGTRNTEGRLVITRIG